MPLFLKAAEGHTYKLTGEGMETSITLPFLRQLFGSAQSTVTSCIYYV